MGGSQCGGLSMNKRRARDATGPRIEGGRETPKAAVQARRFSGAPPKEVLLWMSFHPWSPRAKSVLC